MALPANTNLSNIGFDQIAAGIGVNAGTLSYLLNNGTDDQRTALAAAIDDILGDNPQDLTVNDLTVEGDLGGAGVTALLASPSAIGGTAPAPGAFTTLVGTTLEVDHGTKTATASSGAATLNKNAGVITTEALTTAAGATYTLTLTNDQIAATDIPFASVRYGTSTTGTPVVTTTNPNASQLVIVVQNIHASAALNGTLEIAFMTTKDAAA